LKSLEYKNDNLFFDGIAIEDIAKNIKTPFYIYSEDSIKKNIKDYISDASQKTLFCYSVKANSNLSLLKLIASQGMGFDVVSKGELHRAIKAGANPKRIVYSGVGKTKEEIAYALNNKILCFNVESEEELFVINSQASLMKLKADISIRINPDVKVKTHPYISTGMRENKFGIAYEDAFEIYKKAKQLDSINIVGIDFHIGSQIMSIEPYLDSISSVKKLIQKLNTIDIKLSHIDVGGGLGISYQGEELVDKSEYVKTIINSLSDLDLNIIFEPGRSIVGDCGILVSQVQYVKESSAKNFLIIDASMSELMRPPLYGAYHEITPIRKSEMPNKVYDVVGPVCESSDFIGKERKLNCKSGDLLVIQDVGAYGSVLSSNYNTRPRPAEYMISNSEIKLIRSSDTLDQIIENESC
jgi:diaminopimelate decarboxylase